MLSECIVVIKFQPQKYFCITFGVIITVLHTDLGFFPNE